LADKEKTEINVISRFLPKQMNEEEITSVIKSLIKATNASSIKDMGKIMGALRSQYAGQMDFGVASGIIKQLLS